jgi:oligopeptide transport system substrate-binding protein
MSRKALLLGLGLLTAVSCHKKENNSQKSAQEVRLNIHTEPPSLDPRKPSDTTSCSILKMCFDGLMRTDSEGKTVPALAQTIEISEDRRTYTFLLRDAKWSDGQPVTAYDFEYAWKCILDSRFPSEFANDLYVIKNAQAAKEGNIPLDDVGIRAISDQVFSVELDNPLPYFLDLLTIHSFLPVPKHVAQKNSHWAEDASLSYVCNGPFLLKKWKHHNLLVLEKNPTYWDADQVKLSQIVLHVIEDENTELSMFEGGELDWAGSPLSALPIDALSALSSKKDFSLYSMAGTYYYIFNTREYPFNNAKMRRAFSLAINRKDIVDNVVQGKQLPATSLIPPSLFGKQYVGYFQDGDIEEAKKLFKEALQELGTTAEKLPPITLSYNTVNAHHKIAQAIKEQWAQAFGIRVNLENKEWKVFLDEVANHQFQIARMGGIANFRDPISFLDVYKYPTSRINPSQWGNATYAALLEQAEATIDPKQRLALLEKAEKILMNEMPVAPIYFYTGSYLKNQKLKGVYVSELSDVDFKYAYWDLGSDKR